MLDELTCGLSAKNENLPMVVIGPNTVSSSTVLQFHRRFLNWCLHSYKKKKEINIILNPAKLVAVIQISDNPLP